MWVFAAFNFYHRAAMTRKQTRAKRIFFCAATPGAAAFAVQKKLCTGGLYRRVGGFRGAQNARISANRFAPAGSSPRAFDGVGILARENFGSVSVHEKNAAAVSLRARARRRAATLRYRFSFSEDHSRSADWLCRPTPSSPGRQTSRSPSGLSWRRRPCPDSWRRFRPRSSRSRRYR